MVLYVHTCVWSDTEFHKTGYTHGADVMTAVHDVAQQPGRTKLGFLPKESQGAFLGYHALISFWKKSFPDFCFFSFWVYWTCFLFWNKAREVLPSS